METRPPNIEGRGEVTIRDLVKNSLRMRPDRIVVGECRSGEALDMLQAMNTGHDGSLTTIHANTPRDTLARLETLVLMAGFDLPVRAIREQMASAIDLIVQISRLRDGSRRVTHITEVQGMEGDIITLQDMFLFDWHAGVDENGKYKGTLEADRCAAEVRREARRPGHPPRPRGVQPQLWRRQSQSIPSRYRALKLRLSYVIHETSPNCPTAAKLPPRSLAGMRARIADRWAVLLSVGACLVVALPSPAGAQDQRRRYKCRRKSSRLTPAPTRTRRSSSGRRTRSVNAAGHRQQDAGRSHGGQEGARCRHEDQHRVGHRQLGRVGHVRVQGDQERGDQLLDKSLQPGESVAVVSLGGTAADPVQPGQERGGSPPMSSTASSQSVPMSCGAACCSRGSDCLVAEGAAVNNVIAIVGIARQWSGATMGAAMSRSVIDPCRGERDRLAERIVSADGQIGELSELARRDRWPHAGHDSQPSLVPAQFARLLERGARSVLDQHDR